jgi:hypothetical protein
LSLCGVDSCPNCDGSQCSGDKYYWATGECILKAKIDRNNGKVAMVHAPLGVPDDGVDPIVRKYTKTFFRVDWQGDFEQVLATCDTLGSCSLSDDGMCLCEVSTSEEQLFRGDQPPRREDIMTSLHTGALEPDGMSLADWSNDEVKVFNTGPDGLLTTDSIFEVENDAGQRVLRKNEKSMVNVVGTSLMFRNPVHLISLADPEPRDVHYETDATLDHHLYHKNTAPFLAYRFAQQFGISNPSPRYTEAIANAAFVTGTHTFEAGENSVEFGTGQYGDLAATVAAVLLDREARDFVLDVHPSHGALKEPLIKVIGMMRSLEFELNDLYKWIEFEADVFNGALLGQFSHASPSVFSFFLPEYQPSGTV